MASSAMIMPTPASGVTTRSTYAIVPALRPTLPIDASLIGPSSNCVL